VWPQYKKDAHKGQFLGELVVSESVPCVTRLVRFAEWNRRGMAGVQSVRCPKRMSLIMRTVRSSTSGVKGFLQKRGSMRIHTVIHTDVV